MNSKYLDIALISFWFLIMILSTLFILVFYFNEPLPNWMYKALDLKPPELYTCEVICPPESELYSTKSLSCCRPGTIKKVEK